MLEAGPEPLESDAHPSASLWRWWDALRRHSVLFWSTFALTLLGVVTGVYVRQPSYVSTARLLIESQRREVSVSRSEVQVDPIQLQAQEALGSQVEILQSRDLIGTVAEKLKARLQAEEAPRPGLVGALKRLFRSFRASATAALVRLKLLPPLTKEQQVLQRLQKGLQVYPVRKTQVIELAFKSKQPDLGPLVLSALIEGYLEKVSALRASSEEYEVFLSQAALLQSQLQTAEEEFATFSVRNQVVDLEAEKALLLGRLERLEEQVSGTAAARTARAETAAARPGSQNADLRTRLHQLRLDLARVSLRYGESHLQVREIQEQIRAVETLLDNEARQTGQTVAAVRQRLILLTQLQPEYERLRRRVSIGKDAYEIYRKAAEDRRVGATRSSRLVVQVVDPPMTPYLPKGPNRLILVLAGLVLSCGLALLVVAVREWATLER